MTASGIKIPQRAIPTRSFQAGESIGAIDALRGYAILLVLAAHSVPPSLVWPARRVLLMGFFGVQLFFIASAVTLLMSWARSKEELGVKSGRFFIHRFFRIAPLYFLAIVFYWVIDKTASTDFSLPRLLSTLFFVNTWTPHLLPTTGGWKPVPGGWSISVEFCFYFVFPLLAMLVTTMRRTLAFCAIALVIMIAATTYGQLLYPEITSAQRENFLYFWFPNQLVVFAIGFLLYRCLQSRYICGLVASTRLSAPVASACMVAAMIGLSYSGLQKEGIAPTHLLMTICFAAWAFVVLLNPGRLVVNPVITAIGKVSFSIYIVHFAVLKLVTHGMDAWWPIGKEGVLSLFYTAVSVLLALGISYALASMTYRTIEKPFIQLGKRFAGGFVAGAATGQRSSV